MHQCAIVAFLNEIKCGGDSLIPHQMKHFFKKKRINYIWRNVLNIYTKRCKVFFILLLWHIVNLSIVIADIAYQQFQICK